jgi:hypothetical protein
LVYFVPVTKVVGVFLLRFRARLTLHSMCTGGNNIVLRNARHVGVVAVILGRVVFNGGYLLEHHELETVFDGSSLGLATSTMSLTGLETNDLLLYMTPTIS